LGEFEGEFRSKGYYEENPTEDIRYAWSLHTTNVSERNEL